MGGDGGTTGAALDGDLILSWVDPLDFHLFRFNADSGTDIDLRAIADIDRSIAGAVATDVLIRFNAGVVFGDFKSVEDKLPGDDEEFSEGRMFGTHFSVAADNRAGVADVPDLIPDNSGGTHDGHEM